GTESNYYQRRRVVASLLHLLGTLRGRTVGVLGLAFKPNTDDMRDAPSRDIIALLQGEGARIRVYDPVAMDNARRLLRDVAYCENGYDVAEGCDGLVLVTEWKEFADLDMAKVKRAMRTPLLIDGRNLFDPEKMRALGFIYRGVGRSTPPPYHPAADYLESITQKATS
ncbi:MAG: UDP-glucose 6-dehydrogenase, partial [Dehalococcoidales bacterium]|nr:UDP-glucose 6-dehydrogenase [Dehalococcoidales bacterium]